MQLFIHFTFEFSLYTDSIMEEKCRQSFWSSMLEEVFRLALQPFFFSQFCVMFFLGKLSKFDIKLAMNFFSRFIRDFMTVTEQIL